MARDADLAAIPQLALDRLAGAPSRMDTDGSLNLPNDLTEDAGRKESGAERARGVLAEGR